MAYMTARTARDVATWSWCAADRHTALGVPVVPTAARFNQGIGALEETIGKVASGAFECEPHRIGAGDHDMGSVRWAAHGLIESQQIETVDPVQVLTDSVNFIYRQSEAPNRQSCGAGGHQAAAVCDTLS